MTANRRSIGRRLRWSRGFPPRVESSICSTLRGADSLTSINQPIAHGESNQFVNAMHIELFHDPPAVRIHGVDAQVQHYGDLFIRLVLRQHLQNFALAAGE